MSINLTQLFNNFGLLFWLIGVVLGPIIVNGIAKKKVSHVLRSTVFAFFLALLSTPVLIQIYLLLQKEDLDSVNENQAQINSKI